MQQYELHQVRDCDALLPQGTQEETVGIYVVVPHDGADWKSRPLRELAGCTPRYGRSKMLSSETLRKVFTEDSDRILRDIEEQRYAVVFLKMDCYLRNDAH